jgi:uncharacterized protein DUF4383
MTAKTAAILLGLVFLAVGLLGYVDNPIVGSSEKAMFHTDSIHNIVHIASGALFLLLALVAPAAVGGFLKLFGLVYLVIGIVGMVQIGSQDMIKLFGFLMVNKLDNYLHIALGVIIFLAGFLRPRAAVS